MTLDHGVEQRLTDYQKDLGNMYDLNMNAMPISFKVLLDNQASIWVCLGDARNKSEVTMECECH